MFLAAIFIGLTAAALAAVLVTAAGTFLDASIKTSGARAAIPVVAAAPLSIFLRPMSSTVSTATSAADLGVETGKKDSTTARERGWPAILPAKGKAACIPVSIAASPPFLMRSSIGKLGSKASRVFLPVPATR